MFCGTSVIAKSADQWHIWSMPALVGRQPSASVRPDQPVVDRFRRPLKARTILETGDYFTPQASIRAEEIWLRHQ